MNRLNGTDPGLRNFGLHDVKEERTLRTRFAFFAMTAAGVGTLAAFAVIRPLHADDASAPEPIAAWRAVAPAQPSPANEAYKKTAQRILVEADRLAGEKRFKQAAVLAHCAAALPVRWLPGERSPEVVLIQLMALEQTAAAEEAAPKTESSAATAAKKHRYVAALLDAARDDLNTGRLDLARAKAAAAHKIELAYKFFDTKTSQLVTEIDRLSHGSKTLVGPAANENLVVRGQAPAESPADFQDFGSNGPKAPVSPAPQAVDAKAQAKRLLAEARAAFDKHDYATARIKALKADEFQVKWEVLDDQPQTLLAEIERTTGTKTFARAQRRTAESADPVRAQAVDLIRQARTDLQAGHFEDATKKAQKARQLNVVFGMFEDRPDTVLADIARARAGPRPDLRRQAQCSGQLGPIDLLREVEPDAGGRGPESAGSVAQGPRGSASGTYATRHAGRRSKSAK